MWRSAAQRLAFVPEDGLEVVASGRLTTYPGRSSYQIVIERLELAGEGALLALLARLKARLEAEGLFDPGRKRPLPYFPAVIGVVTSPTGAVIRDILHRIADRCPTRVVVWPVAVQGQGAAAQVAAAVRGFSALPAGGSLPRPDVVIVARGGGSVEDLWAFNEEEVVRAIATSTIPVISAVGHETDTTLADFAADLRAPTPTAAAELAVPVHGDLCERLAALHSRKRRGQTRLLALARERFAARSERLPTPQALLAMRAQRLDELAERLRRGLLHRTETARTRLARDSGALRPALLQARLAGARSLLAATRLVPAHATQRLAAARLRLEALERVREQLHPLRPLERGYVLVTGSDGCPVLTRARAAGEPQLDLRFADGVLPVVPARSLRRTRTAPTEQPKLL
jgi:exodeoxyribonuclease VII large subunit